jgi:hypothetical protein
MLLRKEILEGIQKGAVTLAFRRWQRPSVRAGTTLRTAAGELSIVSVDEVAERSITAADARKAGYASLEALRKDLSSRAEGTFYRIVLGELRPDRRVALRASPAASPGEVQQLMTRLDRLDSHAAEGPWTRRYLELLAAHPAVRAGDLCKLVGLEKKPFKVNVRKLKNLGLTESLEVGYRLSPRGAALLEMLRSR